MHLNLTPENKSGELPREGKVWVTDLLKALAASAKGADISATGRHNPTISRFVSNILASLNMTDLEKYNLLKLYLKDPMRIIHFLSNAGDYSPFSIDLIMSLGRKRAFVEPAHHEIVASLNGYGGDLENELKGRLGQNPSLIGDATGKISMNEVNTPIILLYILDKYPKLFNMLSKLGVPFPVATFRKKGGKLIKKKKYYLMK